MALTKLALKHTFLTLYIDEQQGMVFHHTKQALFQLPAISISLILAIDEGLNQKQVIEKIAQFSKLSTKQLVAYYQKVVPLFDAKAELIGYKDGQYPELQQFKKKQQVRVNSPYFTCQVANVTFAITAEFSPLFIEISTLLSPCTANIAEVDFVIEITTQLTEKEQQFTITCNGLMIESDLNFDFVVPHIIDRLQILAFQKNDYLICFHGAAIQYKKGYLLLPGHSGAGKSTLTALLANNGHPIYSDEIIALTNNFQLLSLQLPIAIKSGSWSLLEPSYPALKNALVWQREDGRQLKYIWPSQFAIDAEISGKIQLVSPNYTLLNIDETRPLTQCLSVIDTLMLLTKGGYQLADELTSEKLDRIIAFIDAVPCAQLTFSTSDQAMSALDSLWQ